MDDPNHCSQTEDAESHSRANPRAHKHIRKGRLLILACSATKTRVPGRVPAYQRYNGPLWQTLRAVDPDGRKAEVAFLSAHYGFRGARKLIECYDARLTREIADQLIQGGVMQNWPIEPGRWHPFPISEIAILRSGRKSFHDVALVGGKLYLEVMYSLVEGFQRHRFVLRNAKITQINGSIGLMRKQLRAWLEEEEVP